MLSFCCGGTQVLIPFSVVENTRLYCDDKHPSNLVCDKCLLLFAHKACCGLGYLLYGNSEILLLHGSALSTQGLWVFQDRSNQETWELGRRFYCFRLKVIPITSDRILLVKTSNLALPNITRAKKLTFQGAKKEGICNWTWGTQSIFLCLAENLKD